MGRASKTARRRASFAGKDARMTATLAAQRRTSPTPPRPLRELPVLFHLMDVSRPKGFSSAGSMSFKLDAADEGPAAPALPRHDRAEAAYQSALASDLASDLVSVAPPPCPAEAFDLETAAELVQTKAYGSLPSEPSVTDAASGSAGDGPHAPGTFPATQAPASDSQTSTELNTPGPSGEQTVTLRERAEERKRKRQEGKKDDWFSTQGRYIAIGFFIALAVTIYVARTGRKLAAPPVAGTTKVAPAVDMAASAKKSSPVKQATATESAKITSVRPTAKATAANTTAASEPKTALHPPTIPQLKSEPAGKGAAADATLFTFTKRTEERVATRTDEPAPASVGAASAVQSPSAPPAAAAGSAPPTLEPHYPTTNYPSQYLQAAPAGGPAAAYASPPAMYAPPSATYAPPPATYAPPPATYAPPAAGAGPALGPAASTMPLYPTTNTASGYRYERTGSSVY